MTLGITIADFRYMRRGVQLGALSGADVSLLMPITQQSKQKNKALLLLHGFSSSPAVYRYLVPQLQGYDAIFCPALPGHAESVAAFATAKASDWLFAVQQHYERLSQEYLIVDVLGLSLGGLLACELSKRYTLHHLYLLAPALKLRQPIAPLLRLAKILHTLGFTYLQNKAGNIMHPQRAEIAYRQLPIATIIEILQLVDGFCWQPPSCPVDLFLGHYDEVVNSNAIEALFASLPNANIHWLMNSAHVLPLDNDLAAIVDCINLHV